MSGEHSSGPSPAVVTATLCAGLAALVAELVKSGAVDGNGLIERLQSWMDPAIFSSGTQLSQADQTVIGNISEVLVAAIRSEMKRSEP